MDKIDRSFLFAQVAELPLTARQGAYQGGEQPPPGVIFVNKTTELNNKPLIK